MITLITAVPGSGKTLSAIAIIKEALLEGRPVYTNINDLQVEKFENNQNLHDAPADWRDTPEGSLVIYDECQQPHLYPSTAKAGRVEDERMVAMETHRHTGHDLIFITQAPTFVHHHVRNLVGQHIHLYRGRGIGGAMRYEWSHTVLQPNDRKEQERADSFFWKFPKEDFQFYKSATVHTHKFKLPKKLVVLLSFILVFASVVGFMFYQNNGLASLSILDDQTTKDKIMPTAKAALAPAVAVSESRFSWSSVDKVRPVAGCIASSDNQKCLCYSDSGHVLDLSLGRCLSVINSPLPRSINAQIKSG